MLVESGILNIPALRKVVHMNREPVFVLPNIPLIYKEVLQGGYNLCYKGFVDTVVSDVS